MRLRYNYYVQLVAARRDWMRVPNLAGRAHHCNFYTHLHDQLNPPLWRALRNFKFGTRMYTVIVANGYGYTQRPFLVALGNRLGWPRESNSSEDLRFLFSS